MFNVKILLDMECELFLSLFLLYLFTYYYNFYLFIYILLNIEPDEYLKAKSGSEVSSPLKEHSSWSFYAPR